MTHPQRLGAAHIPDGKEVRTMQSQIQSALFVARDQRERDIAQAAIERRFASPRPSIRRFVGRRVIAVGQRIAAEPSLELARSR
jgi:hypothetical protein